MTRVPEGPRSIASPAACRARATCGSPTCASPAPAITASSWTPQPGRVADGGSQPKINDALEHGGFALVGQPILALDADLWIWGGDNIYADTPDMGKMRAMYQAQKRG